MEPGDYQDASFKQDITLPSKSRIVEWMKNRGMHNRSLKVAGQGPVQAYPLFIYSTQMTTIRVLLFVL
jgi:hypothetical protein